MKVVFKKWLPVLLLVMVLSVSALVAKSASIYCKNAFTSSGCKDGWCVDGYKAEDCHLYCGEAACPTTVNCAGSGGI